MATHKIRPDELENQQETVLMQPCQKCGRPIPHYFKGMEENQHGKFQNTKCVHCGHCVSVNMGENGEEFQSNVDAPEDTDAN